MKIFVLTFVVTTVLLYGQVDTAWVRKYNGTGSHNDWGSDMVVDAQGNVYVTGRSQAPNDYDDCVTLKYNTNGVEQWVNRYNGSANLNDEGDYIAIDGQGNVYVAGCVSNANSTSDYLAIKYNSNGETLWTRKYNGPGNGYDFPYAIAVDGQANVYITGESQGSGTDADWATIKYNTNGLQQWVTRQNGSANLYDAAWGIAVDGSYNVYVTGQIQTSSSNSDMLTIKYNSNGSAVWMQTYDGTANGNDCGNAIAVDNAGNAYITGESDGSNFYADYVTIKYSGFGTQQWVSRYNGPGNGDDFAVAIVVDNQGNSYITGLSTGISNYYDYATIKYNSNGDTVWVRRYNGPGDRDDRAWSIAVDNHGDVYITGDSYYSDDILEDYATIKYSSYGVQRWIARFDGEEESHDYCFKIALDSSNNVYVAGSTDDTSGYDYGTIKYLQAPGVEEENSYHILHNENMSIFPNPAKTYFTVRFTLNTQGLILRMYDVTGKIVKREELKSSEVQELRISTDGIKNGVYFVRFGANTKKLVITE
jgi:uncharacterized delta-60 repeat protein